MIDGGKRKKEDRGDIERRGKWMRGRAGGESGGGRAGRRKIVSTKCILMYACNNVLYIDALAKRSKRQSNE